MSILEPTKMHFRKRRGCDEDCIRRIAAHLCQLEHRSSDEVTTEQALTSCCTSTAIDEQLRPTGIPRSEQENAGCADASGEASAKLSVPVETTSAASSGCCSRAKAQNANQETSCSSQNQNKCDGPCPPAEDVHGTTCSSATNRCCESKRLPEAVESSTCSSKTPSCNPNKVVEEVQAGAYVRQDKCCSAVVDAGKTSNCCTPSSPKNSSSSTSLDGKEDCCYNSVDESLKSSDESICSGHLKSAFDRYEALLRLGKCLCRTVQEQLRFCCCAPASCKTKTATDGFASNSSKSTPDACRTSIKQAQRPDPISAKSTADKAQLDIEKDAAREHVVVGVSGMTCTGCSRKLMNVLDHVPGVSAAKVTFVTESAEFLLDTKEAEVEQTLQRMERETGFKLSRVDAGNQQLDILLPGISAKEYARIFPAGLVALEKYDKKVFRVTYDPRAIGARSLLVPGAELAPHAIDPKQKEGQRRLLGTAMSFLSALGLTIPVVVLNWGHYDVPRLTLDIVSLVLATFVQAISVPEFYVGAVKSLVYSRVVEVDMLVVLSISAAYLYSVTAFILELCHVSLEQGPFFETAALLITLVLLGRLLSAYARVRAVSAVAMRGLQSRNATLLLPDDSAQQIDVRLLQFGDRFRVSAHSRIVTDGIIIAGQSTVDESMLTGESIPVSKQPGDNVVAGTLNGPCELECQLTRLPGNNSISDIAGLVEGAVEAKPKAQDLADIIAMYFVPCVMVLALFVFAIWIGVAIRGRGQNGGGAVGTALTYAIAVLAVSCPCALGLAVPMVLVIAGGVAAKSGVVVKAAVAVERGYQATDVVFDKTGTLTMGDLQVVTDAFLPHELSREAIVGLVSSLIEGETHPVSVAVAAHLSKHETPPRATLQAKTSRVGLGIEAIFDGVAVKAGNPYWLGVEDHQVLIEILHEGFTIFCVSIDGSLVLAIGLRSSLREESAQVVRELRACNIDCHIVSGDNLAVVQQVGRTLGISPANTVAHSSPAEKQKYVERLQQLGKNVIFVGDGTNDAVAIAQATVGMQVGAASDVTAAVADVVLLGGLGGVVQFLDVSKRAFRRIWFNFIWSAVYNTFAILLAAGAFVRFRIPPAYAGLGEIVSVAPVIVAALTMTMRSKCFGRTRDYISRDKNEPDEWTTSRVT